MTRDMCRTCANFNSSKSSVDVDSVVDDTGVPDSGAPAAAVQPSPQKMGSRVKWNDRIDNFLAQFYPTAKLVVIVVPYYTVACMFYCTVEKKPCEAASVRPPLPPPPPAPPFEGVASGTCEEPWTVIDALYFTTVSVSTVGYGDLVVSSDLSRLFTAVWIVIGVAVVFVQTAVVFQNLFDTVGMCMHRCVDIIDGNLDLLRHKDLQDGRPGETGNVYLYYIRELILYVGLFVAVQFGVGTVILYTEEHFSIADAAWYCFVTSTTVGYGDKNVRSQAGRLYATFHIQLSVIWLAAIIGHVGSLYDRRQRMIRYEAMMRRRLDAKMISRMDRDGNGVDRVEFLVGTLIFLGAEVGGEALSWKHIAPMLKQFNSFDVDGDGKLTTRDLERLAKLRADISVRPHDEQVKRAVERLQGASTHTGNGKCSSKRWTDGTIYDGEWRGNQPSGKGVTVWADGSRYEGQHARGRPHGQGSCRMLSGEEYAGGFSEGAYDGHGVLALPSGLRWEGPWKAGKKHGRGATIAPDGQREVGEWLEGVRMPWAEPRPLDHRQMAHRFARTARVGPAPAPASAAPPTQGRAMERLGQDDALRAEDLDESQ